MGVLGHNSPYGLCGHKTTLNLISSVSFLHALKQRSRYIFVCLTIVVVVYLAWNFWIFVVCDQMYC